MQGTAKRYTREIHSALQYHAIWLPSTPLSLGVIGDLQDGVVVPIDNLKQALGISVEAEPLSMQSTESLMYQSQSGVTIQTKASGATTTLFKGIAEAEAGIAVSFSRQGACVLSLQKYHTQRVASQIRLQRELLKRINYEWKNSYVIVTEVVVVQTGTILVCEDSHAYIEISAKAGTTNSIADIGNARMGLKVAHTEGRIFSVVGGTHLTPLFRGIRVTQNWLNTISIGSFGDDTEINIDTLSDEQIAKAFEPLEQ